MVSDTLITCSEVRVGRTQTSKHIAAVVLFDTERADHRHSGTLALIYHLLSVGAQFGRALSSQSLTREDSCSTLSAPLLLGR
jgi:hypothetical protein